MHIVRFLCPVIGSKLNIIFITILKCCIFACAFSILYCSSSCKSSKTKFQKWFESPKWYSERDRTWTDDLRVWNPMLCQLSHTSKCWFSSKQIIHYYHIYYYKLLQTTEMAAYCTYKLETNIHTFYSRHNTAVPQDSETKTATPVHWIL